MTRPVFGGGLTRRKADLLYASRSQTGFTRTRPQPFSILPTHPSPPTIGAIASATAIPTAKTWGSITSGAVSLGAFTMLGAGGFIARGVSFPDTQSVVPSSHTRGPAGAAPYRIRFGFDGTDLEIRFGMYIGIAYPQVFVDGQYCAAPVISGSASPHDAYLPITFATRAPRMIELRMVVPFAGLRTGPLDTVWPVSATPSPRCIIAGDSYTDQTGSTGNLQGFGWVFADAMNWPDTWLSGLGGSGYLNTGQAVNLRPRLQNDIIQWDPDIVIVTMGHNDQSATTAQIQAEASLTLAQLRRGCPNAYIVVTGPLIQGSNLNAVYGPVQTAIFDAAAPYADDTLDVRWLTGSGRVGATNGTGNADYYNGVDGVHFSDAGHRFFGHRLAEEVSTLIGL